MSYTDRLVTGMCAVGAICYMVGTKTDDALGHDGRSLAIGLAVAFVVGSALSPLIAWWARKAKK